MTVGMSDMSNPNGWNLLNTQPYPNTQVDFPSSHQEEMQQRPQMQPSNSLYSLQAISNGNIPTQDLQQRGDFMISTPLHISSNGLQGPLSESLNNLSSGQPSQNSSCNMEANTQSKHQFLLKQNLFQEPQRNLQQNLQQQEMFQSYQNLPQRDQDATQMIAQYKGSQDGLPLLDPQINSNNVINHSSDGSNKQSPSRFLLTSRVEPFTRSNSIDTEDYMMLKLFEEDQLGTVFGQKNNMQLQQQRTSEAPASSNWNVPQTTLSGVTNKQLDHSKARAQVQALQKTYQAYTQQLEQNQSTNSGLQGLHNILGQQQPKTLEQQTLLPSQENTVVCEQISQRTPHEQQTQTYNQGNEQANLQDQDELDAFGIQFSLPSTMVPPSVLALASTFPANSGKHKAGGSICSKPYKRKRTSKVATGVLPQSVFERLLKKAGHGELQRIKNDDAEYDVAPSSLQLASFGTHLVKAVHTSDLKLLSALLQCGLSPNPCNQFRDSVVDLVCKRANSDIFQCLLEHGSDLQTVDGFGRTPLHHCCWASTFSRPIVDSILERDPVQLLIEDKHGQTPLEYVRADLAAEWIEYLELNCFKYFPIGEIPPKLSSPKIKRPDGTIPDPANAIPVNLAGMVSSGKITPNQILQMRERSKS